MKLMSSKNFLGLVFIILILILGFRIYTLYKISTIDTSIPEQYQSLPMMSLQELAKYDGTDPNLPIYIGLNGLVYDVTPGKEYYQKGNVYNYITGKDSSELLNQIGGDIIARKYKAIAKLEK